jgi:hypothetical protein
MAIPEATFLFLFFVFSPFHLFTINVTQALPLGTIKGEAGATSRGTWGSKQTPIQEHTSQTNSTNSYATKETWDPLPLLKAYNLY